MIFKQIFLFYSFIDFIPVSRISAMIPATMLFFPGTQGLGYLLRRPMTFTWFCAASGV